MSTQKAASGTGHTLSYAQAVARLERSLAFGIHPSLDGIRALTAALGQPQDAFRSIQVTGTNGKTSVTRITAAILAAHGQHTGACTSPHLISYTERVEIDGAPASEPEFAQALDAAFAAAGEDELTEFELLTAAALWLMRERGVDWACLEVGMGGRWDATSVVSPAVSVITGVALDHTERLGATRELISADKAHIIKAGSVAVLGPGCAGVEDIFLQRALAVGVATLHVGQAEDDVTWRVVERPSRPGGALRLDVDGSLGRYPDLALRAPSYQAPNVATAVAAVEAALGRALDPAALQAALSALTFPGRFELLSEDPPLVIDGAHNPEAAGVLAAAIAEAFGDTPPAIVLAVLADKDIAGIVAALAPVAGAFIASENASPRCAPAADMARIIARVSGREPIMEPSLGNAISRARALGGGTIVTGSLYTAGLARALFA